MGDAGRLARITCGGGLVYTSVEAGLLASVKSQRQAEQDILKDWRVKRYARKLERQSAMADLDLTMKMHQLDRQANEKIYTVQRERETQTAIKSIQSNPSDDRHERVEMPKSDAPDLTQANRKRKLSKQQAMRRTLQILTDDPDASPTKIASEIGRTRQTVYDYISELEAEGRISQNGAGL